LQARTVATFSKPEGPKVPWIYTLQNRQARVCDDGHRSQTFELLTIHQTFEITHSPISAPHQGIASMSMKLMRHFIADQ
jgi:hypothetical protein